MDIGTITFLIIAAMALMLMIGVPLAFVSGAIAVVLAVSQFGLNALFIVGSRTVASLLVRCSPEVLASNQWRPVISKPASSTASRYLARSSAE